MRVQKGEFTVKHKQSLSVTPTSPPQRSLSIDRSTSSNGTPTLVCRGSLTLETWEVLKKEVKSLSPQHEYVLADMSGVTFVDSASLGGLLGILVSAKWRYLRRQRQSGGTSWHLLFRQV